MELLMISAICAAIAVLCAVVNVTLMIRTIRRPPDPPLPRFETKPRSIETKGPSPLVGAVHEMAKARAAEAFTAELIKSKAPDRE
jgi:hypothetical protein